MKNSCKKCLVEKDLSEFKYHAETVDRLTGKCRKCINLEQRETRKRDKNLYTKKYEKSEKGFLMRLYRNMKSRINGTQQVKSHLYEGKEILDKESFYEWAMANPDFATLFEQYRLNSFERWLAPSVDRIDSTKGYVLSNMRFITHRENSRLGALTTMKIGVYKNGVLVGNYNGLVEVADYLKTTPSNISFALSGKTKQAKGHTFKKMEA